MPAGMPRPVCFDGAEVELSELIVMVHDEIVEARGFDHMVGCADGRRRVPHGRMGRSPATPASCGYVTGPFRVSDMCAALSEILIRHERLWVLELEFVGERTG